MKEADPIRKPDPEIEGGEIQVKRLQNMLLPKGACH
jgi:hypothetical protein